MGRPKVAVSSNHQRLIVLKYTKGARLEALAEDFALSAAVIRRVLVDAGAEIRGRGRPMAV